MGPAAAGERRVRADGRSGEGVQDDSALVRECPPADTRTGRWLRAASVGTLGNEVEKNKKWARSCRLNEFAPDSLELAPPADIRSAKEAFASAPARAEPITAARAELPSERNRLLGVSEAGRGVQLSRAVESVTWPKDRREASSRAAEAEAAGEGAAVGREARLETRERSGGCLAQRCSRARRTHAPRRCVHVSNAPAGGGHRRGGTSTGPRGAPQKRRRRRRG